MKLIFNQVTPLYYTIYNEFADDYLSLLGTVSWDNYRKEWELFPEKNESLNKEQLNSINSFFQGLEDLHEDPILDKFAKPPTSDEFVLEA